MITIDEILKLYKKEFATTLKVMRAYPENKLDFKPHERSQSAAKIMSTFVVEMFLIKSYVFGENFDRDYFRNPPVDLNILIKDFEKQTSAVISKLQNISGDEMGKTVEFAGTKMTAGDFMMMMLFDQIHHRGQMSVYIRMAGGKVPSVYGPSADDPTTNF